MIEFDLITPITKIQEFLYAKGLAKPDEKVLSIAKPGEGNMNVVLRIKTNQRSLILKQSRPYVEKYKQIAAPINRIAAEHDFYKAIQGNALDAHIPKILGYDDAEHILLLEDLGDCEDMIALYKRRKIDPKELRQLIFILGLIHRTAVSKDFPENLDMRRLNHQHIFELPFMEDNGFSLDDIQPGLQALSKRYKRDVELKTIIKKIGTRYLTKGDTLIHGDYYPGSWMTKDNDLFVIDPEFGFVGFVEFDLGVMAAHLIMTTGKKKFIQRILAQYDGEADERLMTQIAGIEIMRRLIGLAQLPLERTLEEKKALLKKAHKMILT